MRMIRYEQKLISNGTGGYVVASGELSRYAEADRARCLPINFTIDNSPDEIESSITGVFGSGSFEDNYQKILHNECSDWYLYCFSIMFHEVILEFCHKGNTNDSGTICFQCGRNLHLRFSVPHQNSERESKYRIETGWGTNDKSDTTLIVFEDLGDIRRILEFCQDDNGHDDPDCRIVVTEFTDL